MHKFRYILGLVLLLLLSNILIAMNGFNTKADSKIIWVDDDYHYPEESDGTHYKPYTTIQSAINAANHGDTINIKEGTYYGDITIDKSVKITTDNNPNEVSLTSANQNTYMVDIKADNVVLEGFSLYDETNTSHRKAAIHISSGLTNVIISDNVIVNCSSGYAIYLDYTSNAVIKNNRINRTGGIFLDNSDANSIYENYINESGTNSGIRVFFSDSNHIQKNVVRSNKHGISVQDSSENIVELNTVSNNDNNGIVLTSGSSNEVITNTVYGNGNSGIDVSSSECTIFNNTIYENPIGIKIGSGDCIIYQNEIKKCNLYGIHALSSSSSNTIYNNTFGKRYGELLAKEDGNNAWDNGVIGNYWADYLGPDNDFDNIGDIYYTKGGVIDHYPLGKFQEPPEISDPHPANLQAGVGLHPSLSVKINDPEDGFMDVYFYYIKDNTSHLIKKVENKVSGETVSAAFYSSTPGEYAVYTYLGTGYDYIGVWYVIVKDQYSETISPEWIFSTLNVPFDNDVPTANAGGPYSAKAGVPIKFDGSKCNDTDGTIEFYRWSFGDGESVLNVRSPTHTYDSSGAYEVSLVVIDNDGSSSNASAYVTIRDPVNDPPVAVSNGHYTGYVNTLINLNSAGSYDPDEGDSITYSWTFGDGTTLNEENPSYVFDRAGNYSVTLTVEDSDGLMDADSTYIIINEEEKETPGFELVLIAISIFALFFKRKYFKI